MATSSSKAFKSTVVDRLSSSASSLSHRRPLMCTSTSYSPRLAPQAPDLIRWVRSKGGFVHPKLKIADHGPQGLGLVSEGVISSGSELISLPDNVILRLRWMDDSDNVNVRPGSPLFRLVNRVPEELWAMKLGLKLLNERAAIGSFWWPYISNLPKAFNVPIFFHGDEIKSLHYAPLSHQVNKRCKFLLDFEKEVKLVLRDVKSEAHPFHGQNVDASSLGWAMSTVSSRAFRLHDSKHPGSIDANIPMLLPVIDMCNHSFHPNAHISQGGTPIDQRMLVQVVAETQIEQNVHITLNYGCLNNDLFLLDYGFVVLSNPYDHIELKYDGVLLDAASMAARISCPSFSSPAPWQEKILSQLNLHGDKALLKVTLGGPDLVDGRLLAALRVLLASDMELVQKQSLDTLMLLSSDAPLGLPNETSTLSMVLALLAISLQHFPTKMIEDENILKGGISSSMKLAIEFRIQKKFMIIDLMRKLSKRIQKMAPQKSAAES